MVSIRRSRQIQIFIHASMTEPSSAGKCSISALQGLDAAARHLARVQSHASLRHIWIFVHASMTEPSPAGECSISAPQGLDAAARHLARVHSHASLRHIWIFVHASMTKTPLCLRLTCSLLPEHYITGIACDQHSPLAICERAPIDSLALIIS